MTRLIPLVLVGVFVYSPATWAAGPLEESARRAVEQLAGTQQAPQPEGSRKKVLLWGGLAATGAGVALMVLAKGDEQCEDILSRGEVIGTECVKEDNIGAGVAGLGLAVVGVTFTVMGARQQLAMGPRSVAYRIGF